MRQFTVPQFIDVEDKIIGPITVRQFIIMIVAGLFLFLEYKLSDFAFFLFIGIPTALVFLVFAFVKVNGVGFHYFVLNIIQTFKKPALRVWHRHLDSPLSVSAAAGGSTAASAVQPAVKQALNRSRLSDLALLIDTGGLYRGEQAPRDYSFKQ
ncbi:MAG: PrgI family protein [Candidatus Komeilibacteria bacterium]|nr:PrgI family protein [Candidatus Komeilibacteria bacterium]